jgi:polar amino acid transport system substrate-binding protein
MVWTVVVVPFDRLVAPTVLTKGFTMVRSSVVLVAALGLSVALVGCSSADDTDDTATTTESSEPTAEATDDVAACSPDTLATLTPGTLTIATDEPAYEPWMVDNDPTNQEGFEAAVAYAVAGQLGYTDEQVEWVRVPFTAAIQPGPKTFDFDINQFSITEERRQAVDFSSPYYDVAQTVVVVEGTPAADATSIADLADVQLGAQVGTTSFTAIEEIIAPTVEPRVFNSNEDAVAAIKNGQIDALIVDLPTAFYLTSVEIEGGTILGQLPPTSGDVEQFGLVLDLGSSLTECVSQAVDALDADGTLDDLEQTWLADVAGAPVLN